MKTIQNLRNSLKFKAPTVADAIFILVEGKPRCLRGAEVRIIAGHQHAFVSAPSFSHIVRIGEEILYPLNDIEPAETPERDLNTVLTRQAGKDLKSEIDLPEELLTKLQESIPAGYRLQTDAKGNMRLVKTRQRRSGPKTR